MFLGQALLVVSFSPSRQENLAPTSHPMVARDLLLLETLYPYYITQSRHREVDVKLIPNWLVPPTGGPRPFSAHRQSATRNKTTKLGWTRERSSLSFFLSLSFSLVHTRSCRQDISFITSAPHDYPNWLTVAGRDHPVPLFLRWKARPFFQMAGEPACARSIDPAALWSKKRSPGAVVMVVVSLERPLYQKRLWYCISIRQE